MMSKLKGLVSVFVALLLFVPMQAEAAEYAEKYEFLLSVNEEQTVQADNGDILTVVLTLKRTDQDENFNMRAMQDEIYYDPEFFEIIEDSIFTIDGIETKDLAMTDGTHAFYVNFLSYGEETEWKNETRVASFQVKVLGERGGSYLKNEHCKVSYSDGSGSYETSVQDLCVIVTDDGLIENISKDSEIKQELETKTSEDSEFPWWILLAAFYVAILGFLIILFKKPTVTFLMDERNVYKKVKVRRGKGIKKPLEPMVNGRIFENWYKDIDFAEIWDFESDKVKKSVKLYAKWKIVE